MGQEEEKKNRRVGLGLMPPFYTFSLLCCFTKLSLTFPIPMYLLCVLDASNKKKKKTSFLCFLLTHSRYACNSIPEVSVSDMCQTRTWQGF